jgi:parallel beta-helix repeat protein
VSRTVAVTNNQISGSYGPGIRLSMSAGTVTIAKNVISNAGRSIADIPEPFRSGIFISHLQNGLSVTDNELVDDQMPGTMRFGIYDATAAASAELRAVDNHLRASAAVAPFQSRTASVFFVRFGTDVPYLPAHAVAAGSTISDRSSGTFRVQIDVPSGTRWQTYAYGYEPPKSGSWAVGDVVYNLSPVPGDSRGWICVVAGKPGVFRPLPPTSP